MCFFLEILQTHGHDITKPHEDAALKLVSWKIKSAPGKNSSLSASHDVSSKDGALSHKQKLEFKTK